MNHSPMRGSTLKAHRKSYSNLPPGKNYDYKTEEFMHRYMAVSTQKKTGFRQLQNVDKDSLMNETRKSLDSSNPSNNGLSDSKLSLIR